jgi:hypothetical protein
MGQCRLKGRSLDVAKYRKKPNHKPIFLFALSLLSGLYLKIPNHKPILLPMGAEDVTAIFDMLVPRRHMISFEAC